jgi:hypothetical protein
MPNPFANVAGTVAETPAAPKNTGGNTTPVANTAAKQAHAASSSRPSRAGKTLQKAPTSFVRITDYKGELLAVYPKEYQDDTGVKGNDGSVLPGIIVDFLVCSGDDAGTEFTDALVLGKVLVNSLRRKIDEAVILKIGQSEKKAGQTEAWIAVDTTDAEDAHVAMVVDSVYGKKANA